MMHKPVVANFDADDLNRNPCTSIENNTELDGMVRLMTRWCSVGMHLLSCVCYVESLVERAT